MRTLKKILKWLLLILLSLIVLVVAAGLLLQLFTSAPEPGGKLHDVGGFSLYLDCKGESQGQPTLIVESGAGTPAITYYWIQEALSADLKVCTYDRAGLGFSESSDTSRDADTVSHQLHALLQAADIQPPYLMAGHSLGGPYICVFADNYPSEVSGLIFLDSSHPEQTERLSFPTPGTTIYSAAAIAADIGVLNLYFTLFDSTEKPDDLPYSQQAVAQSMYRSGKVLRAGLKEIESLQPIFDRAGETRDFGDLPILVFSAGMQPEELLISLGVDPDHMKKAWAEMQFELAELSTNGKQFTLDQGSHMSIITDKSQADIIVAEIRKLLQQPIQDQSQ